MYRIRINKPKMAYSRDAFIRNQRETRERLERDGAMADGLTYTIKIARERARRSKREVEKARESYLRETRENLQRDQGETRERLARDKRWSYG